MLLSTWPNFVSASFGITTPILFSGILSLSFLFYKWSGNFGNYVKSFGSHYIVNMHIQGGTGDLMVKTHALDLELQGLSPASVRTFFSFSLFNLNALEFTQLYPHQMRRCFTASFGGDVKTVSPEGPGLISLRLFQALVSHYYSGKPERVNCKKKSHCYHHWYNTILNVVCGPNPLNYFLFPYLHKWHALDHVH